MDNSTIRLLLILLFGLYFLIAGVMNKTPFGFLPFGRKDWSYANYKSSDVVISLGLLIILMSLFVLVIKWV